GLMSRNRGRGADDLSDSPGHERTRLYAMWSCVAPSIGTSGRSSSSGAANQETLAKAPSTPGKRRFVFRAAPPRRCEHPRRIPESVGPAPRKRAARVRGLEQEKICLSSFAPFAPLRESL